VGRGRLGSCIGRWSHTGGRRGQSRRVSAPRAAGNRRSVIDGRTDLVEAVVFLGIGDVRLDVELEPAA